MLQFNKAQFEEIVSQTQVELKKYLVQKLKGFNYKPVNEKGYLYAAGSLPVMVVAHMDTVHKEQPSAICFDVEHGIAMSPEGIGGDDRCGVYMILQLLKEYKPHVLFCEDEEVGGVGAGLFVKSQIAPDINFIIEFDRKGSNDAVFYDCDNPDFTKFVEGFGFKEDWGTYSDICDLAPALEVAAVNLSCGYYNAHTQHEYVNINEMLRVIEMVKPMLEKCDTKFEWIEGFRYGYSQAAYGWESYDYYNYSGTWGKKWGNYTARDMVNGKPAPVCRWLYEIPEDVYPVTIGKNGGEQVTEESQRLGISYDGKLYYIFDKDKCYPYFTQGRIYSASGRKLKYDYKGARRFQEENCEPNPVENIMCLKDAGKEVFMYRTEEGTEFAEPLGAEADWYGIDNAYNLYILDDDGVAVFYADAGEYEFVDANLQHIVFNSAKATMYEVEE